MIIKCNSSFFKIVLNGCLVMVDDSRLRNEALSKDQKAAILADIEEEKQKKMQAVLHRVTQRWMNVIAYGPHMGRQPLVACRGSQQGLRSNSKQQQVYIGVDKQLAHENSVGVNHLHQVIRGL